MQVNQQLDKMGYNIGMRLIEDFLAKSNTGRCGNFKDTAEMISKVGFVFPSTDRLADTKNSGRIQDLFEHYTHGHELDSRQ
jgi:hypothetical protein